MDKVTTHTIWITIIGTIFTLIIIYFFKDTDRTLPNYVTVIGTACSLIGLAIAYINIIALQEASKKMSQKIEASIQKINQLNSVSEISRAIKTNQEIQNFIRGEKIELAHIRIIDLKSMLLHFNNNEHLKELTIDEKYIKLVIEFGIDINSINSVLFNPKRKVDFSKITNNLEELSTFLTHFESKIKSLNI